RTLPLQCRDRSPAPRSDRDLSRLARAPHLSGGWRASSRCVTMIPTQSDREGAMPRWLIALLVGLAGSTAMAQTPIVLRDMGSFHVGGRVVEITGKPVREVKLPDGSIQK